MTITLVMQRNQAPTVSVDFQQIPARLFTIPWASFGVMDDGSLLTWGSGEVTGGQADAFNLKPKPVPGLNLVGSVAGSLLPNFYCASLAGGTVKCWGHGDGGNLGDGDLSAHVVAVPGPSVAGLIGAVRIAAAPGRTAAGAFSGHACALLSSGKVMCWGAGGLHALGGRSTDSAVPIEPVPTFFGYDDVCAGKSFVCALERTGFPICWGDNEFGQLGLGTTSTGGEANGTYVEGDGAFKSVSCGGRTACGIKGDGSLWCWGVVTDPKVPLLVPTKLEPSGVEQVSIGDEIFDNRLACLRKTGGQVVCWGGNAVGMLGDGTGSSRNTRDVVTIPAGATDIAVGTTHACALVEGRTLCWGSNVTGAVGDGTQTSRSVPTPIKW
jgi:alpha-tubulin suppressor-like RCC1 family protein